MEQSREAIRPGMQLDVIEQNKHLKSIIYDVNKRRIIIAQTSPPLTQHHLNREISLTFLARESGQSVRYGVQAKVTDFITHYKLASADVPAVGLEQKTAVDTYNLRLDFRVRPPSDSNLHIEWKGQKLNLINISAGGFQFSHRGHDVPEMGEEFIIMLAIDRHLLRLSAKVFSVTAPAPHDPNLHYVGVKFLGNRQDYERQLTRKILEIQRKILADGKVA